MTGDELEGIRERDRRTSEIWFSGPSSFPAMGARDRRALLVMLDEIRERHLDEWVAALERERAKLRADNSELSATLARIESGEQDPRGLAKAALNSPSHLVLYG